MVRLSVIFFLTALLSSLSCRAQVLKPGFEKAEYLECLAMGSHFKDAGGIEEKYFCREAQGYDRIYVSPTTGFDNVWELWQRADKKVVVVSIRCTVFTLMSWYSNFHAGITKANGFYTLGKKYKYSLSSDTSACVHVGWLGCMLSMQEDIISKLDSCYNAGIRDCILTGHSQGGAITYLMTAFLLRKQELGEFHKDMQFKTYCSAAPKPGNYAFAMSYGRMTRGGWAFNVVNADDWVPETPMSVQTPDDFNPTNPFARIDDVAKMGKMNRMDKVKFKALITILRRPTRKSEKKLTRYLGKTLGGMLEDMYEGYDMPQLERCANYQRAGDFIIMMPDEEYHRRHPKNAEDAFEHHMFKSYMELAEADL
ncbi:MAG: lipase family protein [Marinilabiliaceae bacterium]|nr:lipase family protein [Marinilabiliaceae bacterium]